MYWQKFLLNIIFQKLSRMPRKETEIWNLLKQIMFAIAMHCKVYVEIFTRWLPVWKIAYLKPNFVLAESSDFWLKWRPSFFSSALITCQCLMGAGELHGRHFYSWDSWSFDIFLMFMFLKQFMSNKARDYIFIWLAKKGQS